MIKLTTDLRETAIAIAQEAGQAIMQVYADGFEVQIKDDNSPVTSADLAANQVIEQGLQQLTPDLPILSEESAQVGWEQRRHWGPTGWSTRSTAPASSSSATASSASTSR